MGIPRKNIIGTEIALVDYEQAMEIMDRMVKDGDRGYIVVSAVHAAMVAREDAEMRQAVDSASLVVPDGMPLKWAANMLGADLRDRVYGPDLMEKYCSHAAESGLRFFLYGGPNQSYTLALSEKLRQRFPGLKICGALCAARNDATPADEIAKAINSAHADVVWVGTGCPQQEKWMYKMRSKLDAAVLIGVGAAFDFHSGAIKQAPAWMQRIGLEWLYRLSREPRRLLKRYLIYNTKFTVTFARQYFTYLRRSR